MTPTARAAFEAVAAAVRPGHHLPGSDQSVVDARTDTRSKSQRLHDAFEWGLGTALASGRLGTHRGLPVTVIATTTLADLEAAAAAVADPGLPMPAPARTGGGSVLPMRDLITRAAGQITTWRCSRTTPRDRCTWAGRDGWPARISGSSATPATGAAPTPTAPNRATTAK